MFHYSSRRQPTVPQCQGSPQRVLFSSTIPWLSAMSALTKLVTAACMLLACCVLHASGAPRHEASLARSAHVVTRIACSQQHPLCVRAQGRCARTWRPTTATPARSRKSACSPALSPGLIICACVYAVWAPVYTATSQPDLLCCSFGKCGAEFMKGYCNMTCGRCVECSDVPPSDEYTCAQQKECARAALADLTASQACLQHQP